MNDTFDYTKLKDAVEKSKFRKDVIAKEAEISDRTLNNYLSGAKVPGKQTIRLLAIVLGKEIDEFFKKAS